MLGSTKLKTISNIPIMPIKPNTYIEMENEKPDEDFSIIQGNMIILISWQVEVPLNTSTAYV